MKKIKFESKEDLNQFCRNKCLDVRILYKEYIDCIESNGASIKIKYEFYSKDKHDKKQSSLIICVSVYPKRFSEDSAKRAYAYQSYYSKIGIVKKFDSSAYQLSINEREDRGLAMFFKRYVKRLVKEPAEIALRQRLSDVVINAISIKRIGSSFNKTGFSIYPVLIIILLILLFVLRVLIPTGYHPSLK